MPAGGRRGPSAANGASTAPAAPPGTSTGSAQFTSSAADAASRTSGAQNAGLAPGFLGRKAEGPQGAASGPADVTMQSASPGEGRGRVSCNQRARGPQRVPCCPRRPRRARLRAPAAARNRGRCLRDRICRFRFPRRSRVRTKDAGGAGSEETHPRCAIRRRRARDVAAERREFSYCIEHATSRARDEDPRDAGRASGARAGGRVWGCCACRRSRPAERRGRDCSVEQTSSSGCFQSPSAEQASCSDPARGSTAACKRHCCCAEQASGGSRGAGVSPRAARPGGRVRGRRARGGAEAAERCKRCCWSEHCTEHKHRHCTEQAIRPCEAEGAGSVGAVRDAAATLGAGPLRACRPSADGGQPTPGGGDLEMCVDWVIRGCRVWAFGRFCYFWLQTAGRVGRQLAWHSDRVCRWRAQCGGFVVLIPCLHYMTSCLFPYAECRRISRRRTSLLLSQLWSLPNIAIPNYRHSQLSSLLSPQALGVSVQQLLSTFGRALLQKPAMSPQGVMRQASGNERE